MCVILLDPKALILPSQKKIFQAYNKNSYGFFSGRLKKLKPLRYLASFFNRIHSLRENTIFRLIPDLKPNLSSLDRKDTLVLISIEITEIMSYKKKLCQERRN